MPLDPLRRRFLDYRDAAIRNGLTRSQADRAIAEWAHIEAGDQGRATPSPLDWVGGALAVANSSRLPRATWGGVLARACAKTPETS